MVRTDGAADLHAIFVRHHVVEEDEVRFVLTGEGKCFDAVSCFNDRMLAGEFGGKESPEVFFIVSHKDFEIPEFPVFGDCFDRR